MEYNVYIELREKLKWENIKSESERGQKGK